MATHPLEALDGELRPAARDDRSARHAGEIRVEDREVVTGNWRVRSRPASFLRCRFLSATGAHRAAPLMFGGGYERPASLLLSSVRHLRLPEKLTAGRFPRAWTLVAFH